MVKNYFLFAFISIFAVSAVWTQNSEDWNPDHLDADEQRETIRLLRIINDNSRFREDFFSEEGNLDRVKKVLSYQGSKVVTALKNIDYLGSLQKITETFHEVIAPAVISAANAAAPAAKAVADAATPAAKAVANAAAPTAKALADAAAPAARAAGNALGTVLERAAEFIKKQSKSGSSSGGAAPQAPGPPQPAIPQIPPEGLRTNIVTTAKQYQGAAYQYGAMSPPSRFDCSGFVKQSYREGGGIVIPRTSREIYKTGHTIDRQALMPGDLILFDTNGRGNATHVAILLDNNTMIHAVSRGSRTGVITSPLSDAYFSPKIIGYRTFLAEAGTENRTKSLLESVPISDFPIDIIGVPERSVDAFPAMENSLMRFEIYNKTNEAGDYDVYFYNDRTGRVRGDHQRITINPGNKTVCDLFIIKETGQYKLEIRNHLGDAPLVERSWNVL
jgi:cell wall-associated NlpC family hydrolase